MIEAFIRLSEALANLVHVYENTNKQKNDDTPFCFFFVISMIATPNAAVVRWQLLFLSQVLRRILQGNLVVT